MTTAFSGTAQQFQASQQGLLALLVLAIFVIYMVLGILYESFIHPLTILTGLPFAAFGALLALLVFQLELDVYGFVGMVLLVGIVKKNAIMMIDFAVEAERKEGKSPEEAIVEACIMRFRPIMMTTMAALMGTLPIALGLGAGAEARRPLGIVVVGGLAFSQLVTLFVTPVFYTYFDKLPDRVRGMACAACRIAVPAQQPAGSRAYAGAAGALMPQCAVAFDSAHGRSRRRGIIAANKPGKLNQTEGMPANGNGIARDLYVIRAQGPVQRREADSQGAAQDDQGRD